MPTIITRIRSNIDWIESVKNGIKWIDPLLSSQTTTSILPAAPLINTSDLINNQSIALPSIESPAKPTEIISITSTNPVGNSSAKSIHLPAITILIICVSSSILLMF
jgi:hypothetical protein